MIGRALSPIIGGKYASVRLMSELKKGYQMNQEHPTLGKDFYVAIIGAGGINFGSREGPWNHSFRLEHRIGPRLRCTALIDPSSSISEEVLRKKRESFVLSAYKDTKQYTTFSSYFKDLMLKRTPVPHAIIIGCPPSAHGSLYEPANIEVLFAKHFPNTGLFIEKPITSSSIIEAMEVGLKLKEAGVVNSTGYFMRYLAVVNKMKSIIQEKRLIVMAINAFYCTSYDNINKEFFWNKTLSGGPIVEQGTHFSDETPGKLSAMIFDDSKLSAIDRSPRATTASWKHKSGAVGTLTHVANLQSTGFDTHFSVACDGYNLRISDIYSQPTLRVRSPFEEHEQVFVYPNDDPFYGEFKVFIDNIEKTPGCTPILSDFADSAKTYEMTKLISKGSNEDYSLNETA